MTDYVNARFFLTQRIGAAKVPRRGNGYSNHEKLGDVHHVNTLWISFAPFSGLRDFQSGNFRRDITI
jgi:hypothetical protein